MIREATLADVDALVEMGARMHGESPRYSRLSYSRKKVEDALKALIASPDGFVIVALEGEAIIGCAMACISAEWFSEDRIAQEIEVFVSPTKRGSLSGAKLILALDTWAKAKGAVWLQAGVTTGISYEQTERAAKLYEAIGFSRVGIGVERQYH